MRIAIAGAHGNIGSRLVRLLADRGDEVVGIVRKAEQFGDVSDWGGTPHLCDLERAGVEEVAVAVEGADAVVFAAGAGPGSGPERKDTMDRDGAIKLVEAVRASGGAHYVMVSSMGADPQSQAGDMAPYQRAKGEADEALRGSGLPHTIVRPGRLTDDPGTGCVEAGGSVGRGEIPRDDVAAVLAEVIHRGGPRDATFEVVGGETPIAEALDGLG